MALIKCPECGREKVSDTADACPGCGYGIKEHLINQREEKKKHTKEEERGYKKEEAVVLKEKADRGKKFFLRIIWILLLVVVIIISVIGIRGYLKKHKEIEAKDTAYREAINTFEAGSYEKAMRDFMVLDGYRDSQEYVERCKVNIPVEKYNNGYYIQAYKELILMSPEVFERVMNDSEISLGDILYDCRKNCADLGHMAFTEKKYGEAESYFNVCYEYDSISYKDEYLFTVTLSTMKTFWYYFKSGQEIHEGFFCIHDDNIWTLGIDSLGVKEGYYDYEEKDGAIYIPDLEVYIYPPKSEGAGNLIVKKESSSYTFYDNQNHMKNEAMEKAQNEPKDPTIGMTAEEVKASTWGLPQEINKTTYAWGIMEQWVYSGYRYIYFDNGRVTAISE